MVPPPTIQLTQFAGLPVVFAHLRRRTPLFQLLWSVRPWYRAVERLVVHNVGVGIDFIGVYHGVVIVLMTGRRPLLGTVRKLQTYKRGKKEEISSSGVGHLSRVINRHSRKEQHYSITDRQQVLECEGNFGKDVFSTEEASPAEINCIHSAVA